MSRPGRALAPLQRLRRWRPAVMRWVRDELLLDLAFVPVALLVSWALFAIPGLPMTHDGLGLAFLESYRRAYQGGDYLQLWTSFAEKGHGSSFPIMYHRLHPQVFAFLALWTGSPKALKVSIPLLLLVGAAGMRRLGVATGARPWVAWVGGALLMSSSYTVADWFVRGATAEFTAFMLVPWCLRHALRIFDDRWGPVRMALSSTLLFYAHMMTFFVFIFVAFVILSGRLLSMRPFGWPRLRPAVVRGATFVALLTCAIGPYAAAVKYVLAFSGLHTEMRSDDAAYFPWGDYFTSPDFSWSRACVPGAMSVEIGRWTLLCLAVVLLVAPAGGAAIRRQARGLAALGVFFVILQRKPMSFVFALVPGASAIQFPCRLLVFVVPVAILCTAIAVEEALRSRVPWVRLVAVVMPILAVAGQVNLARSTQSAIWGHQVPQTEVEAAMGNQRDVTTGKMADYATWNLFLPKQLGSPPEAPFLEASDGCTLTSSALTAGEAVHQVEGNVPCHGVSFTVHGRECSVRLNQFLSPLLRFRFSAPGAVRASREGTTVIVTPNDGTVVRLDQRGVLDLAMKWLNARARLKP